jgi:hypothetical protein
MDARFPEAQPDGPIIPEAPAPQPAAPENIPPAPPAPGAAHQPVAPPTKRARTAYGLIPSPQMTGTPSAPTLLELAAAYPMYTVQNRTPNTFVPDAQLLFHVLGICDQAMISTERFLKSSPPWMPIVSQLYISVLWLYMIIAININTSYGAIFSNIYYELGTVLRIEDCLIPGPLVPFFQSLAAVNGPFEWIGDILPTLPSFSTIWNAANFRVNPSFARSVPIPAIMLDQLYAMSQMAPPVNQQSTYATFQWYRSVFSATNAGTQQLNRIGPQTCGSLFVPQAQYDSSRTFWNACLTGNFTRLNAAAGQPLLTNYAQLLGFVNQNGAPQFTWFASVATVMGKYCQFFNGSVPLKSISFTGIGAVAVYAKPLSPSLARDWLYPTATMIEPFCSNRFLPRREIPDNLLITFSHADHEIEKEGEQYALTTCTNIQWIGVQTQNNWTAINDAHVHTGLYWNLPPFRFSPPINRKNQFQQIIASRYHQQAANRAE